MHGESDRRRNPGEADLSAVEAPDGTSLFFCRTAGEGPSWLDDFLALEPAGDHDPVPISQIAVALADHFGRVRPVDADLRIAPVQAAGEISREQRSRVLLAVRAPGIGADCW